MRVNRFLFVLSSLILLAVLAGCVPVPPTSSAPAPSSPAAGQTSAAADVLCPAPATGEKLRRDAPGGYCLLFPADYSTYAQATETVYYFGSLMDVSRPKLFVKVEDANGQTAAQVAEAIIAEAEAAGLKDQIKRTSGLTVGGEPAERLDSVPGQDLGRVIIATHGPRVYRLTFVPDDPSQGDVYKQMEALYDLVMRSFRFQS